MSFIDLFCLWRPKYFFCDLPIGLPAKGRLLMWLISTQIDAVYFLSSLVHKAKNCATTSKSVKSQPSELMWLILTALEYGVIVGCLKNQMAAIVIGMGIFNCVS